MKTIKFHILLASILLLALNLFAQNAEVVGTTKQLTKIKFIGGINTAEISAGEIVYIVDSDNDKFTIRYDDGYATVPRSKIKYSQKDIDELAEYRKNEPLNKSNLKPPTIKNVAILSPKSSKDLKNTNDRNSTGDESCKYEIDHIRYCLGKYNKQVMTGYCIGIAGSAVTIVSAFTENSGVGYAAGGVLSLIGTIVIIDGQKWTKRAYIGPNGVGIKFTF